MADANAAPPNNGPAPAQIQQIVIGADDFFTAINNFARRPGPVGDEPMKPGILLTRMGLDHVDPLVLEGLERDNPNGLAEFFLQPATDAERSAFSEATDNPPMRMYLEEKLYISSFVAFCKALSADFAVNLAAVRDVLPGAAEGSPERAVLDKAERQFVTLKAVETGLRERLAILKERGVTAKDFKAGLRLTTELDTLRRHGYDKTYISSEIDRARAEQWGNVLQHVAKTSAKDVGESLVASANKKPAASKVGAKGAASSGRGGGRSSGSGGGGRGVGGRGGGRGAGDKAPPAPADRS